MLNITLKKILTTVSENRNMDVKTENIYAVAESQFPQWL